MAILKVARLGHPALRKVSAPVSPGEVSAPALQQFIDDLIETMREYDGVGLAAPQVHESKRIVVFEVERNPRYPDAPSIPLTVLINPEISGVEKEMDEDWEGCLSVPDLRGRVPRHRAIRVKALDRRGTALDFVAKDFHARVVQHECDHLNGKVFLDRMRDFSSLMYLSEFYRYAEQL